MRTLHVAVPAVVVLAYAAAVWRDDEYARSVECAEMGAVAFDRHKAAVEREYPLGASVHPPMFHFNRRINSCLMKFEHFSTVGSLGEPKGADLVSEVIDIYSNKTMLRSRQSTVWSNPARLMESSGVSQGEFEENDLPRFSLPVVIWKSRSHCTVS